MSSAELLQTKLPDKDGWHNLISDVWHATKPCAGNPAREMTLEMAVLNGIHICDVCSGHYEWYAEARKRVDDMEDR